MNLNPNLKPHAVTLAESLISVITGIPKKNSTRGMYMSQSGSYSPLKHQGGSAAIGSIVQIGYHRDDHCPNLHVLIRTHGLGHEYLQRGQNSLCSGSSPHPTVLSKNMVQVPSNHTIDLHPLPSLLKAILP